MLFKLLRESIVIILFHIVFVRVTRVYKKEHIRQQVIIIRFEDYYLGNYKVFYYEWVVLLVVKELIEAVLSNLSLGIKLRLKSW